MYLAVCELYPGEEVYEDYLHPDLRFTAGRRMELDVFVPSRSLAFEYQVLHIDLSANSNPGNPTLYYDGFFWKG